MADEARPNRLRLTIDSTLDAVPLLGVAVNGVCRYLGCTEIQACRVENCIVEAVTNSIQHAYDGQSGHEVEVVITADETLRFDIRDQGRAMPEDSLSAPAELPDDPLSESGRGLYIVRAIMDEVAYRSSPEGNCLTLVYHIPDEREGRNAS